MTDFQVLRVLCVKKWENQQQRKQIIGLWVPSKVHTKFSYMVIKYFCLNLRMYLQVSHEELKCSAFSYMMNFAMVSMIRAEEEIKGQ